MVIKIKFLLVTLLICSILRASDTLYFRLSNPWNTEKSIDGNYLRKCIKESDHFHTWDYNYKNILIAESFYTDTNFTTKVLCHKYFNEEKGVLEQTRCYQNGRLHGYFVNYDAQGDTISYQVYQNGEVLKEWNRKQHEDNQVITMTMTIAEFPDGTSAWLKYLTDNLNYPRALKKEKISGKVIVKVSIDATGTVSNVEIVKSLHPLLDEEVIRVIKNSPTWKPAMQNGRNVQYSFNQAVNF